MNSVKRTPTSLSLYEKHRPELKTGDAIAFSGHAGFSEFIKALTHSPYSHIGTVMRDQSNSFGDTLFIVESTTSVKLSDADGHKAIQGVQLHFLSKRLAKYDGSAFWVPLKTPIPEAKRAKMEHWLRNIYVEKVPYSYTQVWDIPFEELENIFGLDDKKRPDYNSLFCSELVAKALQIAGKVDASVDPQTQTPADIVNYDCFESPILVKEDDSEDDKEEDQDTAA